MKKETQDAVNDIEEYKQALETHKKRFESDDLPTEEELDAIQKDIANAPESVGPFLFYPQTEPTFTKSGLSDTVKINEAFKKAVFNEFEQNMDFLPTGPKRQNWTP